MADQKQHWNSVYKATAPEGLSWFEPEAAQSLRLLRAYSTLDSVLIDIGSGVSGLLPDLLDLGYREMSALDLSGAALHEARQRIGGASARIRWFEADVTRWTPDRQYDLWHDRAVFHFLTGAQDQARYVDSLSRALRPGGVALLMTFADDGPESCSGLPVVRYSPAALAARFEELQPGGFEVLEQGHFSHMTPTSAEQRFQFSVFRRHG